MYIDSLCKNTFFRQDEEQNDECDDGATTYNIMGFDIKLDPNATEIVLQTARIKTLDGLVIPGANLRKLCLIANAVQKIDDNLRHVPNLIHLELYQNQIKLIEPKNLNYCTKLEVLDLSFNNIRKIPENFS